VQRSFRWPDAMLQSLDERAEETGESRNALAQRLVEEGLRAERHPLIRFRRGEGGPREAALVGSRIYVWQAIATLRGSDNSVSDAAEYLGVPGQLIQAAIDYYADFRDEVDAAERAAAEIAERERSRWERAQQVLAG
jgi:hypothetical protein